MGTRVRRTAAPDGISQVDRAYSSIRAGIVGGRYAPGTPMSEVALAAEHGMSRTPVREGLSRLWTEHYLDRVAGRGYFVARVTVQSIHDTFDVRRVLEGAAAARAADLATPEEIAQLRTLAAFPMVEGNYRQAEAVNARFHLAVAAAAHNRLVLELIERCLAQVDRFMSLGVSFGPFQASATESHLGIVEAIALGRRAARAEAHGRTSRLREPRHEGRTARVGIRRTWTSVAPVPSLLNGSPSTFDRVRFVRKPSALRRSRNGRIQETAEGPSVFRSCHDSCGMSDGVDAAGCLTVSVSDSGERKRVGRSV